MKNGDLPASTIPKDRTLIEKDKNGLTKREYFAAKAMQGILSDQTYTTPNQAESIVKYAVELADALLTQLSKQQ